MAPSNALAPGETEEKIASVPPTHPLQPGETEEPLNPAEAAAAAGPSVTETTGHKLKRIGMTLTDPKTLAGVGVPLAASALLGPETSTPVRMGVAALGGAASPYAEYAVSKASGGNPDLPDAWDAIRSGVINGIFEGAAVKSRALGATERAAAAETATGARQTATEMSQLPEELRTPENIRAAVKNRDVLKKLGMNDQQIDEALKNPADAAERLQQSVNQGKRIRSTFEKTTRSGGDIFHQRFADAYGEQGNAPATVTDIGNSMQQVVQQGGQHELTPSFSSWLNRKGAELNPPEAPTMDPTVKTDLGRKLDPKNPSDKRLLDAMKAQGVMPTATPPKQYTVQDLADLRTELRENVPANPTALDRKAALAFDKQIGDKWESALRQGKATEEQIGRLKGLYEDWGEYRKTVNGLRPGQKDFGEQTADAFFKTAKQNPTLALGFAKMAEDAGTMPEFREAFMQQLTQEMKGASGGPISQMEALRKLQTEWRTTEDGKAVLSSVFGKNSPMADPVEFSRIVSSAGNDKALGQAKNIIKDYVRSPSFIFKMATFYATYSLIVGSGASPWTDMRKDPERAMVGLAGAMLTLGGINKIMGHVAPPVQRVYADWLTTRDPAAFEKLIRLTGQTVTGITSQPKENP